MLYNINNDTLILSNDSNLIESLRPRQNKLVHIRQFKDFRRSYIYREAHQILLGTNSSREIIKLKVYLSANDFETRSTGLIDDYQDPFIIQPIRTLLSTKLSTYFSPLKLHIYSTTFFSSEDTTDSEPSSDDYDDSTSPTIWEENLMNALEANREQRENYQRQKFLSSEANSLQIAYSSLDIARKYVEAQTTSVFCPASQIILPESKNSSWSSSESQHIGQQPVIKQVPISIPNFLVFPNPNCRVNSNNCQSEAVPRTAILSGDKLHLILRSDQLDILNPSGSSILEMKHHEGDPDYIEVIYSNLIFYDLPNHVNKFYL